MLKSLFCFACMVSYASGSTIISVLGAQPFYENSINLYVAASGAPPHHPNGTTGSAFFADDYWLTISGGTGQDYFKPCLFAGETLGGSQAMATASFGGDTIFNYPGNYAQSCIPGYGSFGQGAVSVTPIPFTYGIPQLFRVSLEVDATEGSGEAALYGFQNLNGGNLQFTLVEVVEVPEPATWWLLGGALSGFVVMRGRLAMGS